MSRIDVVGNGKEYRVMVNFVQSGVVLHSPQLANEQAKKLNFHYPKYSLNLFKPFAAIEKSA